MLIHAPFLGESFVALGAGEGFFAGMRSQVRCELGGEREVFAARRARPVVVECWATGF